MDNNGEFSVLLKKKTIFGVNYAMLTLGMVSGTVLAMTETKIEAFKWIHLCFTYNGPYVGYKILKIYINGALVETQEVEIVRGIGNPIRVGGKTPPLAIGASPAGKSASALIDELRIWNSVRTAEEVAQQYRVYYDGPQPNLAGYWRFNEGYGTEAQSTHYSGLGFQTAVFSGQVQQFNVLFSAVFSFPPPKWSPEESASPFSIEGELTPRLWPQSSTTLMESMYVKNNTDAMWYEICIPNLTDWRDGVNLTAMARKAVDDLKIEVSRRYRPSATFGTLTNVYKTLRQAALNSFYTRSLPLVPYLESQLVPGPYWISIQSRGGPTPVSRTVIQTYAASMYGCLRNCSGNGYCRNGVCHCSAGRKGYACEKVTSNTCPARCVGITVCFPPGMMGFREFYKDVWTKGEGEGPATFEPYANDTLEWGKSNQLNSVWWDGVPGWDHILNGTCKCYEGATFFSPYPTNLTETAVAVPPGLDARELPATYTCAGTVSAPSTSVTCTGSNNLCCPQFFPAQCLADPQTITWQTNGTTDAYYSCVFTATFTGAALSYPDGSWRFFNASLPEIPWSLPATTCFVPVQDKCSGHGTYTGNATVGTCACDYGYLGDTCSETFQVSLKNKLPIYGDVRCTTKSATGNPESVSICQDAAVAYATISDDSSNVLSPHVEHVRGYSYYSYEYTDPCADVIFNLTSISGQASMFWSMDYEHLTKTGFSVPFPDENGVSSLYVSHRNPDLKVGTISIAVVCIICPARFRLSVNEQYPSAQAASLGNKIEGQSPGTAGQVLWYEVCISNASNGIQISVDNAGRALPFVVSNTLPASVNALASPTTQAASALLQPSLDYGEQTLWTNFDWTTGGVWTTRRFCGAEPAFRGGSLYIGISGPIPILSVNCAEGNGLLSAQPFNLSITEQQHPHLHTCVNTLTHGQTVNGLLNNNRMAFYTVRIPADFDSINVTLNMYEQDATMYLSQEDPYPGGRGYGLSSQEISVCKYAGSADCTYTTPSKSQIIAYPMFEGSPTYYTLPAVSCMPNVPSVGVLPQRILPAQTREYIISVQCPGHKQCNSRYSFYTNLNQLPRQNYTKLTLGQGWVELKMPALNITYCPGTGESTCQSRFKKIQNRTVVTSSNGVDNTLRVELTFPATGTSHVFITKENFIGSSVNDTVQTPGWRWLNAQTENPRTIVLSKDNAGFTYGTYVVSLLHECDASCAPEGQKTVLSYYIHMSVQAYVPGAWYTLTTPTDIPLTLRDSQVVSAKKTAYFILPVTDPCDDLHITISSTGSTSVSSLQIAPSSVTTYPSASSWGWQFHPTGANATFVLNNGYSLPQISLGVHCELLFGCAYDFQVKKVTATLATNISSGTVEIGLVNWYSVCIRSSTKGLNAIARQLTNATNRKLGFFVSRSKHDHPKTIIHNRTHLSTALSTYRNPQEVPYWLSMTDSFGEPQGSASIDLCPGTPGFELGTYYLGVFAMCLERTETSCFDTPAVYTLEVFPASTVCTIPLVTNETIGAVIPPGTIARFHVDLDSPCTDVSVGLNNMYGSHPFVFMGGEDVPLPGPDNMAFFGRDKASLLKQNFVGTATTRVNVGMLCTDKSPCKVGVSVKKAIVPTYSKNIDYFQRDYDFAEHTYFRGDPQQIFKVICTPTQQFGQISVRRIASFRTYPHWVPPADIQDITVHNDLSISWDLSRNRQPLTGATSQVWGLALAALPNDPTFELPLQFNGSVPGFNAGRYFLSMRCQFLNTFALFETTIEPKTFTQFPAIDDESLHMNLKDGDGTTMEISSIKPYFFKFYLDNHCKKIVLTIHTAGILDLFVSNTVEFPTLGEFTWLRKISKTGVMVPPTTDWSHPPYTYTLDAFQEGYKPGWYYFAFRCGGGCINVNTLAILPFTITFTLETAMIPSTLNVTAESGAYGHDYSEAPDGMWSLCVSSPMYGLEAEMLLTAPTDAPPLLFIARWPDNLNDSPSWTMQRAFEKTSFGNNSKLSVCSGTFGFETGKSHLSHLDA